MTQANQKDSDPPKGAEATDAFPAIDDPMAATQALDAMVSPDELAALLAVPDFEEDERTLAIPIPSVLDAISDPEILPIQVRPAPELPVPSVVTSLPLPALPVPVSPARPAVKHSRQSRDITPKAIPRADIPVPSTPPLAIPRLAPASPAEFAEEATRVFDQPQASTLPRGQLVIVEGKEVGRVCFLNRECIRVGRSENNEIIVSEISVSRHHFQIERHAEGFRVKDLGSGNGTVLNGKRITDAELYDGDCLELGERTFEFTTVGEARIKPNHRSDETDPNVRIQAVTPTRGLPQRWIILWSLATFLAVFGAMYITRRIKQSRTQAALAQSETAARTLLDEARAAVQARAWSTARTKIEQAQQLQPKLAAYAQELAYIDRADAQMRALQATEIHLEAEELIQAEIRLREVGQIYESEAAILRARLGALQLEKLLAKAEADRDQGQTKSAQTLVQAILKKSPGNVRALALEASLTQEPQLSPKAVSPQTTAATATKPPPKKTIRKGNDPKARSALARGMEWYRSRRFAEAAVAFDQARRLAASRGLRAQAKRRMRAAKAIDLHWKKAAGTTAISSALAAYKKALSADRILGGKFAGPLKKSMAKLYARTAINAFSRGRKTEALTAAEQALRYDPSLGQMKILKRRLVP